MNPIEKREETTFAATTDAFSGLLVRSKCICGLGSALNPAGELTMLPQTQYLAAPLPSKEPLPHSQLSARAVPSNSSNASTRLQIGVE